MTLDEFFAGRDESRGLFDALRAEVDALGSHEMKVTKSQVAFARTRTFAWAWMPDQYLGPGQAPLVFTVSLREPHESPRWKEVVQTGKRRYTHHLEIWKRSDIDDDVRRWLRDAWDEADQSRARKP